MPTTYYAATVASDLSGGSNFSAEATLTAPVENELMAIQSRFTAVRSREKRLELRARDMFRSVKEVMEEHADKVALKAAKYPAAPNPESALRRTFEYQRQWLANVPNSAHESKDSLVVEITNDAIERPPRMGGRPYARGVRGDNRGEGQFGVHKGRWTPLKELLDRPGYNKKIRKAVKEALA